MVQVAGEASGLPFADLVSKGELRTNVQINGKFVDYLNRHITSKNETPERIRLAIPAGLLREGENRLRIEQVAEAGDPNYARRPGRPRHRAGVGPGPGAPPSRNRDPP